MPVNPCARCTYVAPKMIFKPTGPQAPVWFLVTHARACQKPLTSRVTERALKWRPPKNLQKKRRTTKPKTINFWRKPPKIFQFSLPIGNEVLGPRNLRRPGGWTERATRSYGDGQEQTCRGTSWGGWDVWACGGDWGGCKSGFWYVGCYFCGYVFWWFFLFLVILVGMYAMFVAMPWSFTRPRKRRRRRKRSRRNAPGALWVGWEAPKGGRCGVSWMALM